MNQKQIFCPQCAAPILRMKEPRRWICLKCRKIWEVHDVLEEAMMAVASDLLRRGEENTLADLEGGDHA